MSNSGQKRYRVTVPEHTLTLSAYRERSWEIPAEVREVLARTPGLAKQQVVRAIHVRHAIPPLRSLMEETGRMTDVQELVGGEPAALF